MHIDRCYCYQKTFAALKTVADSTGADSVDALQAHLIFGRNCGLCHPYVRRMLATGQTTFHEVLTEREESGGPDEAPEA